MSITLGDLSPRNPVRFIRGEEKFVVQEKLGRQILEPDTLGNATAYVHVSYVIVMSNRFPR